MVRPSLISNDKLAVLCGSDESPVRRNVDFLLVNSLLVVQSNLREDTSLQESIDLLELTSELNGENASKCLVPRILIKSLLHGLDEIVHTIVCTGASLSLVRNESNSSAFDVSVPGVQVIVSNTALANVDGSLRSILSPNLFEGQFLTSLSPRSVIQSGKLDSLDTAVEELGLQIDAGEHLLEVEIKYVDFGSSCTELTNSSFSSLHTALDSFDSLSILVDTESSCLKILNTLGQRSNGSTIVKVLSELINLILKTLLGSIDSTLKVLLLVLKSSLLILDSLLHVGNLSVNALEIFRHLLVELLKSSDLNLHLLDSSGVSTNSGQSFFNFHQTCVDTSNLVVQILHCSSELNKINLLGVESVNELLSLGNSLLDCLFLSGSGSLSGSSISIVSSVLLKFCLQSIVVSLCTSDSVLNGLVDISLVSLSALKVLDGLVKGSLCSSAVRSALFLCSLQRSNLAVQIGLKTIHLLLQVLDVFIVVLT